MSRPIGKIDLEHVLDALNDLPPEHRRAALEALRRHDPETRYFTLHDGRIDAQND